MIDLYIAHHLVQHVNPDLSKDLWRANVRDIKFQQIEETLMETMDEPQKWGLDCSLFIKKVV